MLVGRRSDEAVSKLVAHFNQDGLAALEPHGKGGPKPTYGAAARERILAEARRTPDPQQDGTASKVGSGSSLRIVVLPQRAQGQAARSH